MNKLPLLVIEDESAVMSFLRAALERNGYQIVGASSGAEGLKLLESGRYMGVISDMRTPGGVTGADVHAWIRANRPELLHRILSSPGTRSIRKLWRFLRKQELHASRSLFALDNCSRAWKCWSRVEANNR